MISSLVVTSEDRSEHAEEVVGALLAKAARASHRELPARRLAPPLIRPLTKAAMWRAKGKSAAAAQVIVLARYLANEIEKDDTVVAFHFDADCAWPNVPDARADSESLRTRVAQQLDADEGQLAARLVPIVAHWCIESWTYQHTIEAAAICREAGDEVAATHFEAIDTNRAALDVTERPAEDARYRRVGKKHNHRLATHASFPASKVLALEASFAAALRTLLDVLETPNAPPSEAR